MKSTNSAMLFTSRLVAVILILSAAGCLPAPYPVSPDVTVNEQVEQIDDIILTLDPSELLEKISRVITDSHKNIEIIDEVTFWDTAYPEGGWKRGQLLEPDTRKRISTQLDVRYLVVVGPEELFLSEGKGFGIPPVFSVGSAKKVSNISAVIIDMRSGETVCQISSEAHGTSHGAFWVVIFAATIPLTESSAINGLAKETGRVIDELAGSERVRIAVIAAESTFREQAEKQKVLKALQERARQGEPDAQWELYQILPTDKNLVWLCRAADQGQVGACNELGKLYFYGTDNYRKLEDVHVQADLSRSCMWFHLAGQVQIIDKPETKDTQLGSLPYTTIEVERTAKVMSSHEIEEAEKLLLAWGPGQCDRDFSQHMVTEYAKGPALTRLCTAADQGDFSSRDELGRIYFLGSRGVKPDLPRAYMWYRLAEKVYVPFRGSMHSLCDAMTTEQRSIAVKLLEGWKPGKCEQDLLQ
ncbi:MAG: tetratricopeptide repeat protein [Pseudomonadota bacterium]